MLDVLQETVELPLSGRGVVIQRPPVPSSMLRLDLAQATPRPKPPRQKVRMGGEDVWEENIANPDYQRALIDWNQQLNIEVMALLVNFAVLDTPDEEDMVKVDQIRAMLGNRLKHLTDQEVFVRYVLCQGDRDYQVLAEAVSKLTYATEAQIANHTERFRR